MKKIAFGLAGILTGLFLSNVSSADPFSYGSSDSSGYNSTSPDQGTENSSGPETITPMDPSGGNYRYTTPSGGQGTIMQMDPSGENYRIVSPNGQIQNCMGNGSGGFTCR